MGIKFEYKMHGKAESKCFQMSHKKMLGLNGLNTKALNLVISQKKKKRKESIIYVRLDSKQSVHVIAVCHLDTNFLSHPHTHFIF